MAQTFVDCLTRIFNRSKCCSDLDSAMRQASEVAYILADLDQFKKVNDTYGHGVGDAVRGGWERAVRENINEIPLPDSLSPLKLADYSVEIVDHGCQLDAYRFRKHQKVVSCDLGCVQSIFKFASRGNQFCEHFLSGVVSEHQALYLGEEDARMYS